MLLIWRIREEEQIHKTLTEAVPLPFCHLTSCDMPKQYVFSRPGDEDYVVLTDGRKVRVSLSFAVIMELNSRIGVKKFQKMGRGDFDIDALTETFLIMIREGEQLEGREFKESAKDLKRLLSLSEYFKLTRITARILREAKGGVFKIDGTQKN